MHFMIKKVFVGGALVLCGLLTLQQSVFAADWVELDSPITSEILGMDCGGSCIGVGQNGTILRSEDRKNWETVTSGTTSTLRAVDIYSSTLGFAVGNAGTILKSTDDGQTWTSITGVTSENLNSVSIISGTVYIAGDDASIFKTTDGGTTWTNIGSTLSGFDTLSISAYSVTTVYISGKNGGIFKTTDGGSSWTALVSGTVYDLRVIKALSSTTVYVGGNRNSFLKTTDGSTFSALSLPGFGSTETITGLSCASRSLCMVVGNLGGSATTSDSGATWTADAISGTHNFGAVIYASTGIRFVGALDGTIFTYDNYAPSGVSNLGLSEGGSSTTDTTPALTWTAATDDESFIASYEVDIDEAGVWENVGDVTSYEITSTLSEASHTFSVRALDGAGNEGAEETLTFTVTAEAETSSEDTTAPAVGSVTPTSATTDEAVEFTALVTDAGGMGTCVLYVDGSSEGSMSLSGSYATKTLTFTEDGTMSVYARCTDAAGNVANGIAVDVTASTAAEPSEVDEDEIAVAEAAEHTLIKTPCSSASAADVNDPCHAVYYFDGKRHAFPNEKVFFTWYENFDDVIIVTKEYMASITLGVNVTYHPGTRMVKFLTVNTVYAVGETGELRAIASEDVAESIWGSDWNTQIDDISDAFFGNYRFGEDVVSTSDFDPEAVEASISDIAEMFTS